MSNMNTALSVVQKSMLAALPVVLLAGAGAQQVSTDYDHSADFQQFHTFSINKVQASNSLVEQRLRDDLQRDLTSRG